ncbi:hypothetical protein [uncultured Tenacibaculum sp.]|uniref:hypothetical protein n=1 Tax=uncultured Tenacibaculum sp. TaxID=174713 RepID=UPI00261E9B05|nr:hypothetical protein [uncultured Tenacibaculum sp.]
MKKSTLVGIGSGIVLVSLISYVKTKKKQLEDLIRQLEFKVSKITDFNLSLKHIAMNIHLQALNPTSEALYINTGFIKAQMLRVYHKKTNKLLAFTNLDTNTIDIPNGGFYVFAPIHIKIPLLTGGELLLNQLVTKSELQKDFIKELAFELEIAGLGKKRIIKF